MGLEISWRRKGTQPPGPRAGTRGLAAPHRVEFPKVNKLLNFTTEISFRWVFNTLCFSDGSICLWGLQPSTRGVTYSAPTPTPRGR